MIAMFLGLLTIVVACIAWQYVPVFRTVVEVVVLAAAVVVTVRASSTRMKLAERARRTSGTISVCLGILFALSTSGIPQTVGSDDLASHLRSAAADYNRRLKDAETKIRGAGFACAESLKAWHPELSPPGQISVICRTGLPTGGLYYFQLHDDGRHIVVTVTPSLGASP